MLFQNVSKKNVQVTLLRISISYSDAQQFKSPNQPRNRKFLQCEPKPGWTDHGCLFQPSWFDHFPWLHYDKEKEVAFCFTCFKAEETKSLSTHSVSQNHAFTKFGPLWTHFRNT